MKFNLIGSTAHLNISSGNAAHYIKRLDILSLSHTNTNYLAECTNKIVLYLPAYVHMRKSKKCLLRKIFMTSYL